MLAKNAQKGVHNTDAVFDKVRDAEHAAINQRRAVHREKEARVAGDVSPLPGTDASNGSKRGVYDTTGLSLSGGGIRSAAFCLGALQSLEAEKLICGIDYLSTVSGGGYIGASMSACMSEAPAGGATAQEFPFGAPDEYEDREAVGHLRDYSNYLLPRGGKSFLDIVTVLLRGWVTNLVFIFGALFLLAVPMVWAFPSPDTLCHGSFLARLLAFVTRDAFFSMSGTAGAKQGGFCSAHLFSSDGPLVVVGALSAMLGLVLLVWAVWRSRAQVTGSDVSGFWISAARILARVLIIVTLIEIQPVVLSGFMSIGDQLSKIGDPGKIVGTLSAFFSSISGAAVFFRAQLGAFLKSSQSSSGLGVLLKRVAAQGLVWVGALVLPLLIYALYLWLCADAISGSVIVKALPRRIPYATACVVYPAIAVAFFVLISRFAPNANSLHQTYRDKLSKAFLFDPIRPTGSNPALDDLPVLDGKKLADISPETGGPYHLINAALNLQGSKYANRRGRNATFFLFSAKYVGSDVTDYAETDEMLKLDSHLDLGTAMAVSGAAVSANMGAQTISALAPTLALLNIRLGYWLVNPRAAIKAANRSVVQRVSNFVRGMVGSAPAAPTQQQPLIGWFRRWLYDLLKFYLLSEMFGQLDETSPHIYVTDGGHIENLGLYQLLKRGCRAIVVVDSEADPNMTFHALSIVERYARIDLGVRIDLPWQQIGQATPPTPQAGPHGEVTPPLGGPHCALGQIHYPNGEKGMLLYVKACCTGDEPDYVNDYRARNPSFPHESTGDQFFSEEQFEAYRALGFHSVQSFFDDRMEFLWNVNANWPAGPGTTAQTLRDDFLNKFA